MARLDFVVEGSEIADRIRLRRGGRLTPLDGMLLHSPPVADGWNSLLGAIRERSTLPADVRELVILRVAELNGADYEWAAHEPVARRVGLSAGQIAAVREGADDAALDERQRAALAYTDAMTREVEVPEQVFAALGGHFDQRQIVELTVTAGAYNLVSRFLVALRIGVEDREGGACA
jgi:AhpD family alkylhydroperoxidase